MKATVTEIKPRSTKTKQKRKVPMTELPGYKMHMENMMRTNVSYRETAVTINDEGEILQQSYKTVSRAKEDDFIKLYLSDVGYFHNLQPSQQELLYHFLKKMNFDNQIVINKAIKEMIGKDAGKSLSTVNNALSAYVESGILLRQDTGVYLANPYLFGKGHFENIQKIRTELVYTSEGIAMKCEIEKSDDL